jgi:hypothetical protein
MTRFKNILISFTLAGLVAAFLGLSMAGAQAPELGNPQGDTPRSQPTLVVDQSGAYAKRLHVVVFKADDGLCFRADEPSGERGTSTACINPEAAPYDDPNAVVPVMTQRRDSATVQIGVTPAGTSEVAVDTPAGTRRVPATPVGAVPAADGRRVYVVEAPVGTDVTRVRALDASGATISSHTVG